MKKALRYILLGLAGILVIMQFFRIDKSVPPYDQTRDLLNVTQAPAEIATLMRAACYDCHSYETKYPWYANVAPVSWWLKGHINEGREHLNYSMYGTWSAGDQAEAVEETLEAVKEGWMPLDSYKWNHPEARLTTAQRQNISTWLESLSFTGHTGARTPGAEEEEKE